MLLSILCIGYLIGSISIFPDSLNTWIVAEEKAKSLGMKMPFIEEARESLGLLICFIVNFIFLTIGLRKAKLPGYNTTLFKRK